MSSFLFWRHKNEKGVFCRSEDPIGVGFGAPSPEASLLLCSGALCNVKIKRRRSDAAPHVAEEGQGKPALGDEDVVREELKGKILELLEKRAQSSTICPSEAPRALHPETWRDFMDVTREVARQLALDGRIEITQKGRALDPEDPLRGPIRLRLASGKPPTTSGPPNSS